MGIKDPSNDSNKKLLESRYSAYAKKMNLAPRNVDRALKWCRKRKKEKRAILFHIQQILISHACSV